MSSTPPPFPYSAPPPPPAAVAPPPERVPSVAWLIPLAAVLAVIGAFTPWFRPNGTYHGELVLQAHSALYSWKDGRIGLIAPIVLVVLSFGVIGLFRGRTVSRFERGSKGPVVGAARAAMIAGAVSVVFVAIAWFLVPGQYDSVPSGAGGSWSGAERLGVEMSRGPQVGYFLTIGAAVLAIVAGALMLALRDKTVATAGSPQSRSMPMAMPAPMPMQPPAFPPAPGYQQGV